MAANNRSIASDDFSVLVVDDDEDFLDAVRVHIRKCGVSTVTTLSDSTQIFRELAKESYSMIFLDWVMPEYSGAFLLPMLCEYFADIPVVILSAVNDIENIISCIKQGATNYITKPVDHRVLQTCIDNIKGNMKSSSTSPPQPKISFDNRVFNGFITESPDMRELFSKVEWLAKFNMPLLITGETGVGKDLIANAIHKASGLTGAFNAVNVSGLDDLYFDDLLFGNISVGGHSGLLAASQGGTIFLDEVSELSIASQVKLSRLLSKSEYVPVGSSEPVKSHARLICSTNCNLKEKIADKTFREDLYYLLNKYAFNVPPLRNRPEDILPLAKHFIKEFSAEIGKKPPNIAEEAEEMLVHYKYPGNVRELMNIVLNGVVACSHELTAENLSISGPNTKLISKKLKKLPKRKTLLCTTFDRFRLLMK